MITKKILLPANLSGIELETQVESEANQVIPFPLDEVNLDFQVLGSSRFADEEMPEGFQLGALPDPLAELQERCAQLHR